MISLTIQYADGTEKSVTAIAADIVAFETKFDLSIARLEKEVKLTHLLYMAWNVERRNGDTKVDFDKWVDTVANVVADDQKK